MLHFFALLLMVLSCTRQYLAGLKDGTIDQNCPITKPIDFRFDAYHRFEEIVDYIDSVGKQYCGIAKVIQIGTTFEGNPIKGIKIGTPALDKPIILIDATFHAREWITSATAIYIINQLLSRYDNDFEIWQLLNIFDWYILPVMNPDGYKYSWESKDTRLWRKNRSPASIFYPNCRGVDMNRNFPVDFGRQAVNKSECGDYYPGPFPFSELETQALRDFILRKCDRIKAYVNIHAHQQKLVSPYGFSNERTPDYEKQMKALAVVSAAIQQVHGQNHIYGTVYTTIGPTSGNVLDWAYISANITYSFAIEMRDKFGYEPPSDEIIPSAEEIYAGIKALANYLMTQL